MTKERLESLLAIADQIEDLEKDVENLDTPYDRYEVIGRLHGESLSNADVLCQLDGDMLAIIIDYLTNKSTGLKMNLRRLE